MLALLSQLLDCNCQYLVKYLQNPLNFKVFTTIMYQNLFNSRIFGSSEIGSDKRPFSLRPHCTSMLNVLVVTYIQNKVHSFVQFDYEIDIIKIMVTQRVPKTSTIFSIYGKDQGDSIWKRQNCFIAITLRLGKAKLEL